MKKKSTRYSVGNNMISFILSKVALVLIRTMIMLTGETRVRLLRRLRGAGAANPTSVERGRTGSNNVANA